MVLFPPLPSFLAMMTVFDSSSEFHFLNSDEIPEHVWYIWYLWLCWWGRDVPFFSFAFSLFSCFFVCSGGLPTSFCSGGLSTSFSLSCFFLLLQILGCKDTCRVCENIWQHLFFSFVFFLHFPPFWPIIIVSLCLLADKWNSIQHQCPPPLQRSQLQTPHLLWPLRLPALWPLEAGSSVWGWVTFICSCSLLKQLHYQLEEK